MRTVLTPISISVTTSVALRPIRSPKCPKIAAPKGRATKPRKKVEKERSVAANGSCDGK